MYIQNRNDRATLNVKKILLTLPTTEQLTKNGQRTQKINETKKWYGKVYLCRWMLFDADVGAALLFA